MFLVMHGQTEWNRDGLLQGHRDTPLTEEGRRQARSAGTILKPYIAVPQSARIVASPLGRTQTTAAIVADCLGIPPSGIATDARLAEIRLGSWEGLTREQIRAGWPERMTGTPRNAWFFKSPDAEDYDSIAARLADWLVAQREHEMLIAVSHGIAGRVLRGLFAKLSRDAATELEVARDAPYKLWNGRIEKLAAA